jgi:predicted AAA+ superfamily ATPase
VYWRDGGLLHALHGIGTERLLASQPWVGATWQGFVIEQLLAALAQRDHHCEPYFFRTSDQHEIDLVLDLGGRLCALEIKLTSSPGVEDLRRLRRTADLIGAERCVLVSRTREAQSTGTDTSCSPSWLVQHLDHALGLR